jgi:hypothetical protein
VRGQSSILLDGNASDIALQARAVIHLALNDVQRLNQYTPTTGMALTQSQSLGPIGESVVLLHNNSNTLGSGGSAVALATTVAAIAKSTPCSMMMTAPCFRRGGGIAVAATTIATAISIVVATKETTAGRGRRLGDDSPVFTM